MKKYRAYSLVELLVAVSIVAIISTLVVVNYSSSRARARDANRKDSVSTYQKAVDQYFLNTGTYMISKAVKNVDSVDSSCNYAGAMGDAAYTNPYNPGSTSSWGRLGYKVAGNGCNGYNGQGIGKMTRSSSSTTDPDNHYQNDSIASVLKDKGYITEIRTDPKAKTVTKEDEPDYVYTICNKSFRQALTPAQAVNYAIFASTEMVAKDQSESELQKAKKYCGGEKTGKGWLSYYADAMKIAE